MARFHFLSLLLLSGITVATSQHLDVSPKDFDLTKLDPKTFDFHNGKEIVQPDDLPGLKKALTIPLAASPPSSDSASDFKAASLAAIKESLPLVLKQLNVPTSALRPALTQDVAEAFEEAATAALVGISHNDAHPLMRRKIGDRLKNAWDKFKGAVKDLGKDVWGAVTDVGSDVVDEIQDKGADAACGVWAPIALSSFLLAEKVFREKNSDPLPLSEHQKFFIAALHGNGLQNQDIKIFYRAKRPGAFKDSSGVTFGHNIYTIFYPRRSSSDPDFTTTMKHVLHETTHSKQYRALNWSLVRFGTRYMFEYCKAGFNYEQNSLEKEAYRKAGDKTPTDHSEVQQLLEEERGRRFFRFWAAEDLKTTVGYPNAKTYESVDGSTWELGFEKGVVQIHDQGGKWCYRTFSGDESKTRKAAECVVLTGPCKKKRSPPVGWHGPGGCDPKKRAKANAKCKKNKSAWKELSKKKWKCGVSLPKFT